MWQSSVLVLPVWDSIKPIFCPWLVLRYYSLLNFWEIKFLIYSTESIIIYLVLKFDSFSGGNGEKVFTKLAKAFEKANPDVDVQLRFEKEWPDVLNKENAKGEYSDVVYYNLGQPSGYTETQLNTHEVLDISDVVEVFQWSSPP